MLVQRIQLIKVDADLSPNLTKGSQHRATSDILRLGELFLELEQKRLTSQPFLPDVELRFAAFVSLLRFFASQTWPAGWPLESSRWAPWPGGPVRSSHRRTGAAALGSFQVVDMEGQVQKGIYAYNI